MRRYCAACGDELPDGKARYCSVSCGELAAMQQDVYRCLRCGKVLPSRRRYCEACVVLVAKAAAAGPSSAPRSAPHIGAESEPGKSTGRPRKYMGYGDGENANGLWDNIVKAMEDG